MQNLQGKTIVFFGATGGIGESVCAEFCKAGANLVLVARNQDKLSKLKEKLGEENSSTISADASSILDVQKVFAQSFQKFGGVDAVVISVGTWKQTSINNSAAEIVAASDELETSIARPVIVVDLWLKNFCANKVEV